MDTVSAIKENRTCCACGICAAVCPVHAITMGEVSSGEIQPVVSSSCIRCGKCLTVCAGNTDNTPKVADEVKICINVASKKEQIRRNATSGGFVTTLISRLLETNKYDGAFLVKNRNYSGEVQSTLIQKGDDLSATQKSRYIQVVHTQEIAHILANPSGKYILVGTPCYFRGFLKVVQRFHLNRENYLLIGLFCDKTMTTHVWEYFNRFFADSGLEQMDFRSKENAGWPGDVVLFKNDGTRVDLSRRERMDVKEYFMAESCLYCMDKMNLYADFSVGDNYISGAKWKHGSNSVVIRTQRALEIYESCKVDFEEMQCSYEEVLRSQKYEKRDEDIQRNKAVRQKKMAMGATGEYDRIREEIMTARKRSANPVRRLLRKCKRILKC